MKLTHAYSRPITTFTILVISCIVILDAPMRLLSLRTRRRVSLLVRMLQTSAVTTIIKLLLNEAE